LLQLQRALNLLEEKNELNQSTFEKISENYYSLKKFREGDFGYIDASGMALRGKQKLEAELTLRNGRVVWDLNALSAPSAR
jgi:hypothetical protein